MKAFEILAGLPQFVLADTPRALYNVLSSSIVTERTEAEGLVLQSGAIILTLEGANLTKFINTMQLQAEQLKAFRSE